MDKATNGINQLLWFIHRTLFELIPSVLLDVFIYFFMKSFITKHKSSFPDWIVSFKNYLSSNSYSFWHITLIFSIVIITHLLLEASSIVLGYTYIEKRHSENYETYPNYLLFKDKINTELKTKFGDNYSFNPQEVVGVMRYKIMEEHKEFNTYLWYITTGTTTLGNLTVALMFVSVLFIPLLSLDYHATTDFFKIYYPILVLLNAAIIWIFQSRLLNKKIKELNVWEMNNNLGEENKSFLAWGKYEIVILSTAILGYIFFCIGVNQSSCYYEFLKNVLFSIGLNLLLLPLLYLILVYKVIESKRFGKKMLDAFISIRYNKEIFNEN